MNHAPAVQYPVGRSVWAVRCQAGLVTLWAGALGWWCWSAGWGWPDGAWWFAAMVWAVCAVWWRWRLQTPLDGVLHWEPPPPGRKGVNGVWRWFSQTYRHGVTLDAVVPVLDVQSIMLVRCRTAAGLTLWLWLQAATEPELWSAMRRAAHSTKA